MAEKAPDFAALVHRSSDNKLVGIPVGETTLLVDIEKLLPEYTAYFGLVPKAESITIAGTTARFAEMVIKEDLDLRDGIPTLSLTAKNMRGELETVVLDANYIVTHELESIVRGFIPWGNEFIPVEIVNNAQRLRRGVPQLLLLHTPTILYTEGINGEGRAKNEKLTIGRRDRNFSVWSFGLIIKNPEGGELLPIFNTLQFDKYDGPINNRKGEAADKIRRSCGVDIVYDPAVGIIFRREDDEYIYPNAVIASLRQGVGIIYFAGFDDEGEEAYYAAKLVTPIGLAK